MQQKTEYEVGMKWQSYTGNTLTVLAVVQNKYLMLRFKGAAPFVKYVKEMPAYLKHIDAGLAINKSLK